MSLLVVHAFGSTGAPLAGLSPTWTICLDAPTGGVIAQPTITGHGGGVYSLTPTAGYDLTGIVDLGAAAVPRYQHVSAETRSTFAAYNSAGAPLAGLSPTWSSLIDVDSGAAVTQPTIVGLGGGVYRFVTPATATHAAGMIDLGATSVPRYLGWEGKVRRAGGATTTLPAIRASWEATIRSLTPLHDSGKPFRRHEYSQPLADWADAQPLACYRVFAIVVEPAYEGPLSVSGGDIQWCGAQLDIQVAYPLGLDGLFGQDNDAGRYDRIYEDGEVIAAATGVLASSHVDGSYATRTVLHVEQGEASVLLHVVNAIEYARAMTSVIQSDEI